MNPKDNPGMHPGKIILSQYIYLPDRGMPGFIKWYVPLFLEQSMKAPGAFPSIPPQVVAVYMATGREVNRLFQYEYVGVEVR